jgi:hypothetical protein
MEDFIQLLIEVFEAKPRKDWKDVLRATAEGFGSMPRGAVSRQAGIEKWLK